ncbi:MAG TPA: hypothetical protein VK541_13155, partial [Pedobacter sp.]|uniref:hypothetical protein n=1 Tax=Pedobacter sp. TaxID=1411316 RepID=UPI002BEBED82
VNDPEAVKKGVDMVKALGLKYKQYGINNYVANFLNQLKVAKQNDTASVAYIDKAIAELK